jgi:serine/threonine protein kinase
MGSNVLARLSGMMKHVTFDDQKALGCGMYGIVYPGVRAAYHGTVSHFDRLEVAVKRLKEPVTDIAMKQKFMSEVVSLAKLEHPACLSIIGFDMPPDGKYLIVTERLTADLDRVIDLAGKRQAPSGWGDTAKSIIALGVAAGLAYLHSMNIIHRDVKPANVLLDSKFYPRIADFGFARIIPVEEQVKLTMDIGTPLFMAPELVKGDDYSFPLDVYAYGMMMYIVVTESIPFSGNVPFPWYKKITSGLRPEIPPEVPQNYRELITQCWHENPSQRPTFASIIATPDNLKYGACDQSAFDAYKALVPKPR